MSRLILIRHAQASLLSDNYDQLSDLGHEQSQVLGNYLAESNFEFDAIYTGPLHRHWQTLTHVKDAFHTKGKAWQDPTELHELKEHQAPETLRTLLPQLVERYPQVRKWHEEAQVTPQLARKTYLRIFHLFIEEWAKGKVADIQPDHLEDWATFRSEVSKGVQKILEGNGRGKTVVAFTSGGTISAVLGHALKMPYEEQIIELNGKVKNTSITEFLFTPEKFSLQNFNTVPHLREPRLVTFV
ncbi:MAG: histidine phosphatase family protein [Bacteroidia bacterium]|nr:histidine phosphatase family protein [Bacteroidia bacterium]